MAMRPRGVRGKANVKRAKRQRHASRNFARYLLELVTTPDRQWFRLDGGAA